MTVRAGRRAFYLGFAALCGIGGSALPAAAQSYLADNGSSVTVDYSVLGQGGPGPVTRGALPGSAMPVGGCSCANAPMGVIAAPPRPTFTNPFGAQVTQAPAVPPGFMAYSQVTGSSSSGGAVVLKEPGGSTQMAANAPAPVEESPAAPLPSSTQTQSESTGGESTGGESTGGEAAPSAPAAEPALPATTPTQNAASAPAGEAAAPSGGETPPAQPETMPTEVPSPVEQPPAAETPPAPAPSTETQTAEAPPVETPPAPSTEPPAAQPEGQQQAAVTPAAPAEGTTPPAPAEGGGALPAGATRILYTGESDDVPAASTAGLDTIAQDLLANQDKRIQVMSYAAGTEDTESKARRKSLARGLAVRSYLIKAGVRSTRIDVRALGTKAEGGPADRVDVIPAS